MRLQTTRADPRRAGAALLMAVLILIVLAAIVFQIFVATNTAARVGRNDVAMSAQELAIDSALLEMYDQLKTDGESADGGGASAPGGAAPAGGGAAPGGGAGGAQQSQACDSQRDEWYKPARTEINEVRLRVFAQDEDSKVNVLTMLVRDDKAAKEAYERVVRVLDKCREGTTADIDSRTAEELTKAMLEYMTKGKKSEIPRATQISDDPANEDLKLPRSLREFEILKPFEPSMFRDFRDDHGQMVHSIESFLTVWTALETAGDKPPPPGTTAPAPKPAAGSNGNAGSSGNAGKAGNQGNSGGNTQPGSASTDPGANAAGSGNGATPPSAGSGGGASPAASGGSGSGSTVGAGGWQVNLNTAPPAVLKSLFDDREVNPRFWDKVIEYRNLEEDKDKNKNKSSAEPETPAEPVFDEYGREVLEHRIFENLAELEEVDGWKDFSAEVQTRIKSMLTVQSRVFSVFVVARRATAADDANAFGGDPQALRLAEERGDSLMRVVRSVVWRHKVNDDMVITPLIRWETLDSTPHEVLDFPEDVR